MPGYGPARRLESDHDDRFLSALPISANPWESGANDLSALLPGAARFRESVAAVRVRMTARAPVRRWWDDRVSRSGRNRGRSRTAGRGHAPRSRKGSNACSRHPAACPIAETALAAVAARCRMCRSSRAGSATEVPAGLFPALAPSDTRAWVASSHSRNLQAPGVRVLPAKGRASRCSRPCPSRENAPKGVCHHGETFLISLSCRRCSCVERAKPCPVDPNIPERRPGVNWIRTGGHRRITTPGPSRGAAATRSTRCPASSGQAMSDRRPCAARSAFIEFTSSHGHQSRPVIA